MYGKDTICVISIGAGPLNSVAVQNEALVRLNATTDEYAIIYRCQKAMTIDNIALNLLNVTGAPTFQVSIQGVNLTNGNPDGTILGGASPASVQFAPTANGLQWITLDNSISVTQEQMIAIVIEDGTSGTNPGVSDYMDLVAHDTQLVSNSPPFIKTSVDTGGTWASVADDTPSFGFRDSGTTNDVIGNPIEDWYQQGSATGGSGQITAQGFLLPASFGRRVQVHGVHFGFTFSSQLFELGIWDSDGSATEMGATGNIDNDVQAATFSECLGFFPPVWLDTNHLYYAGLRQTAATGNCIIYEHDSLTNDNLSAFSGYPNNVTAKYNTSWAANVGKQAGACYLLISDWDHDSEVIQSIDSGIIMP